MRRSVLIAVAVCAWLTVGLGLSASQDAQPAPTQKPAEQPPAKQADPKAAPAQPAATPAEPQAPEGKAYQDAMKISDLDKRIDALRKVVADFPKTNAAEMAESQIFSALVKKATDSTKAVEEYAKKALEGDKGHARLAGSLLTANLLLEQAEALARKGVDTLDQTTWIADQKKQLEERRAEALKRDPKASTPMPTGDELIENFKASKQAGLVTLAQILDKRGKTTEAEKTFKDAYTLAPKGSGASTSALKLAEYAKKAGREADQMEYLTVAALAGRLQASDRADFEALYKKTHSGSLDGLEEMLDARYAKDGPKAPHATPYVRTKDRTSRVVLAEVFTGAGCPPCAGADLAYDAAMERYRHSELAVLMYHMHIPRPDPMTNPYTLKRAEFYAIRGVPTAAVDGEAKVGGGSASAAPKIYAETVEPAIEKRLKTAPGAKVQLKAGKAGDVVTATVSVSQTPKTAKKLRLHVVLAEAKIRYSGENGVRYHPMVVRNIAMGTADAQGFVLQPGKSFKTTYAFDVSKTVAEAKAHLDDFEVNNTRFGKFQFASKKHDIDGNALYVVAFVQDEDSKEILQSAIVGVIAQKR